jgi:nucleoside-diphosphate kinase
MGADEATLVVIKPDAMHHGLTGAVFSRLETLRLEIIGAKMMRVSRVLAEEHYRDIRDKPFFEETVEYLRGKMHGVSAVPAFVFWGPRAVARVREVTGLTHPEKADPTSIRGAFGRMATSGLMENNVHASATIEDAEREIQLWFKPEELLRELPQARGIVGNVKRAGR